MICPSCGNDIKVGNRFCNMCGASIEAVPTPTSLSQSVEATIQPKPPVTPAPVQVQVQVPALSQQQPQYQQQYQPQYQQPVQPVYAPVPVQPAYQFVAVPVKSKKRHPSVFNIIATILYVISFFLPFVYSFGISGGSMFDAITGASRSSSLYGGASVGVNIIIVGLILILIFGLIDSFANTRVLAILASLAIIGFLVLMISAMGGFGPLFSFGPGLYGFALSAILYFIGGCSGV